MNPAEQKRTGAYLDMVSQSGRPLVPLEGQIACVERELRKRLEVYPRLVAKGSLTREKSTQELAAMRAVLDTLQQVVQRDRLI